MKILIGTDGSEFSTRAGERVVKFIRPDEHFAVRIISIYEAQVPLATEPYTISAECYQKLDEVARLGAQKAADKMAALVRERLPANVKEIETTVELGRPAELIVEAARKWNADLIVLGSHGRGFWGRLAIGSVSDAVLHHAPCSVLIVRSK